MGKKGFKEIPFEGKNNKAASHKNKDESVPPQFTSHIYDYDKAYLDSLIDKAKSSWSDVGDADEWLRELRGSAE